jgi:serine/threonine protein kinase/tetratricopeptide (TPR) repeat protein
VEELLAAHRKAGEFLGGGESSSVRIDPASERPGTMIGHYKLVQQIGEGGFGIVFLAEQREPVRRTVALKIVKPGMDSRQVVARFEAERQALAMMDHPNIAKVLDAGTIGASGRRSAVGKERLSVMDRVAAQASLTPDSSPLASGEGRPYFVMELVKGVPITRYCDEQQLTVRERLSLFVPVCQAVQHAHQKGIIHRDLKPTNVLVAAYDGRPVPKVIDFGVAKALGQQLTERTLVTGFGGIIGTLEYMSPEQAEFNALDVDTRADIYSLGVLLYELLTGTTPLTKARLKQTAITEVLRLIREEEPPKPSIRLSDSKDTLASISAQRKLEPARLTREVRGELDWIVMKALDKDRSRRYETANGLARDIERYLNEEPVEACPPSAIYRMRKFARKNRKWLATAGGFVLILAAGTVVSAWQAMRAIAAERQALASRDAEAEQRKQAEKSQAESQAVIKFFQDKVLSAVRSKGQEGGLGKNATIRDALDQAEPQIAQSFTDKPLAEASLRNTLGVSYWYLGDLNASVRQQERALALRRQVLGSDDVDTVGVMNDLGIVLHTLGRYQEAQKLFEEAVETKRRILGPEDPRTLRSMNNLAAILAEQGLFEAASKLCEETLRIQTKKNGPEDIFRLRSAYNLAIMLGHLGKVDEARKRFDETLATLRRVFGREHQDTLRVMAYLGELLLDQAQPAEAQKLFEDAVKSQRSVLGLTHVETLMTTVDLADTLRALGHLDQARKLCEEAVQQERKTVGADTPPTLSGLAVLADILRDDGQFPEARKIYEETLIPERRVRGPRTPETQRLLNGFAWMLCTAYDSKFRDPPRAVLLAKEVVTYAPQFGDKWMTLGVAHYRAGDWKSAVVALEKSTALAPAGCGGVNGFFLAMAHWQLGEKEQASQFYAKGASWRKSHKPTDRELLRFQSEASELLGISESKAPVKIDDKLTTK